MDPFSLVFKVHHPFYLRPYRFFDIDAHHNYYDDYRNKYVLKRFSERSYEKANRLLIHLFERYGERLKVAFVFSGNAVDQMQWYAPELLENFKTLLKHPNVEVLASDDSGGVMGLLHKELWEAQVLRHRKRMEDVFGKCGKVLAGTQLLYDDQMGAAAFELGFKGMLTEGAKPVLGWKSPHVVYRHPDRDLKLILRDGALSENISLHFAERPQTAEKFVAKALENQAALRGNCHVTMYCNYAVFGEFQGEETGIFDFLEYLPAAVFKNGLEFAFPSDLCRFSEDFTALHVPFTISDMDEEKDLTAFYANELQRDVMENWKNTCPVMMDCKDGELQKDFRFLTGVEHLLFMSTKYFTEKPSVRYLTPYDSPYDAYINYMNVWADFTRRLAEVRR